jgi:hypothetical protein
MGWVKGEPKRFISTHHMRTPEHRERQAATIGDKLRGRPGTRGHVREDVRALWYGAPEDRGYETPCLIWQGHIMNAGYGELYVDGRRVLAHRWAYERAHGKFADDLNVHHLCEQRTCINTDHMQLLTRSAHQTLHLTTREKDN